MALTEKVITSFTKFIRTFKGLYPSEKLIFGGLGSFIIVLVAGTFLVQVKRNVWPYQLILVAGRASGESYILSEALARVVKNQTNIRIDVCATGGTEDNLHLLEGLEGVPVGGTDDQCRSGKQTQTLGIAQLATAQADRVPEASARLVAILYEDRFQLLVNPTRVTIPSSATTFDFNTLIGKTIDIPAGGGQRESFKAIARHFKPSLTSEEQAEHSFRFQDAKGNGVTLAKADAVFRVRILGSEEIRNLLKIDQLQLVPLKQAQAMQSTRYPAYEPSVIPEGTYQGSSPIPSTDLDTIAVQRTLLAREDVPDWVVEKITTILSENRKELKDEIQAIAKERNAPGQASSFDAENVSPLVDRDKRPPDHGRIPIHKGANAYYERDKPAFVQANADFLALILTIILLGGSWLLQLKSWSDRQKQLKSTIQENIRKEKVDIYIKQVIEKMKLTTKKQTAKTTLPDLFSHLKDLFERQEQLDFVFQSASASLDQEEISQEGFRAFSEAYKSAKEVIERAITENQRKFSSYYVEKAMALLDGLKEGRHPDAVLTDLDTILKEATEKSINERIFSRESFRTLTDVYSLIRNAIELKRVQQRA